MKPETQNLKREPKTQLAVYYNNRAAAHWNLEKGEDAIADTTAVNPQLPTEELVYVVYLLIYDSGKVTLRDEESKGFPPHLIIQVVK